MICVSDGGREKSTGTQRIDSVMAQVGPETISFKPSNVISSIPPGLLTRFLYSQPVSQTSNIKHQTSKRTVILVYLFLAEEPRFPHAWLQVTCPSTRIGRITNYAAFSRDMVSEGKTCLCCEMYCFGPDELLEMNDQAIVDLTLADSAKSGLLDPARCFDHLVLRLPGGCVSPG